jgi:ubiquinone/menaquinone biosynthesis C-methylase UbiE
MMTHKESYDAIFFEPLFAIEDRHFWFLTRNKVIFSMLNLVTRNLSPHFSMLEVGCGTGNVLHSLSQSFPEAFIGGIDLFSEGLNYARKRGCESLAQADIAHLPFSHSFDVVGIFDVLEHLPDEEFVLRRLQNILKPDGRLLITVPALPVLWSYFDVAAHHCRRYTKKSLQSVLLQAGYHVEFISYFMMSIVPLVWAQRAFSKFARQSGEDQVVDDLQIIPGLNGGLRALLSLESQIVRHQGHLPIGTSLMAIVTPK